MKVLPLYVIIDSARFMVISLSNLLVNLAEGCKVFLNMKVLKTIWWNINIYIAIKIIQTSLMKN